MMLLTYQTSIYYFQLLMDLVSCTGMVWLAIVARMDAICTVGHLADAKCKLHTIILPFSSPITVLQVVTILILMSSTSHLMGLMAMQTTCSTSYPHAVSVSGS